MAGPMAGPINTQGYDQAKTRQYMKYTDQHGRRWGAPIDVKSMAPTGPWRPIEPSRVPLMPPMKFIRIVPDAGFDVVRIDYEGWKRELREAHTLWERLLRENAYQKYGDKAGEAIQTRPPALMQLVGPEPPAVEPVILAERGQRWLLGFDQGPMPDELRQFFPEPETPEVVGDLSPELAALLDDVGAGAAQNADPQANGTPAGPAPSAADDGAETAPTGLQKYNADVKRVREAGIPIDARPTREELDAALELLAEREAEGAAAPAGSTHPSWG